MLKVGLTLERRGQKRRGQTLPPASMKGLVSVADRPWKDMLAEMMRTNSTMYDLLLGKRAPFSWDDVRFQK